jgi:iron complex transport system substrate-binding protein
MNINQTATTNTLPLKDPAGNDIQIPKKVDKIISLAPSYTETLINLGLSDKIIAIDKNAKGIKGLKEGIPDFDMMSPDIEKMISLKPDIIIASGLSSLDGKEDPFKALKDSGICVISIPTSDSIEKIKSDIIFIADATGKSNEGKQITEKLQLEIDKFVKISQTIENKKTVYFEIATTPNMYTCGNGVFLNELIEIAGGKNVFAHKEKWLSISNEAVIASNPDVIFTNVNYTSDPVGEIKSRKGWKNMNAIKNGSIYYIDNSASSLPNENIVKAIEQIAKLLYPEKFL